jgi:hypothetical protein
VDTGGSLRVRIGIHREHYKGPIRLVSDPPGHAGVTIDEAEAAEEEDSVEIVVHVGKETRPGNVSVHLRTADAALMGEVVFDLAILYMPPGYEAKGEQTETDADDVRYYKRIWRQLNEKEQVEFVLIPRKKKKDLQPDEPDLGSYYISRCKITRGQFGWFAPEATDESSKKYANDEDRMPARGVTLRDAYGFAHKIGGHPPGLDQWDKATGLWHPSRGKEPFWEGPYRGKWDNEKRLAVAVDRRGPLRIDDDGEKDDVSAYGCQGMAGNGREWTTRAWTGREVPFEEVRKGLFEGNMILRGWNFNVQKAPLTFEELEYQRTEERGLILKLSTKTDLDIGFRVVLEPKR